jgi:hypothetical protein
MLQDSSIDIRIKLAALWTSLVLCYLYGDYFELYTPGKVTSLISGDGILDTPAKLFAATLVLVAPSIMVPVTVIVRPPIVRASSVVLGIGFAVTTILIAISSLTSWYGFYVLLAAVESVIAGTIAVMAWKWPTTVVPSSTGPEPVGRPVGFPPPGEATGRVGR